MPPFNRPRGGLLRDFVEAVAQVARGTGHLLERALRANTKCFVAAVFARGAGSYWGAIEPSR